MILWDHDSSIQKRRQETMLIFKSSLTKTILDARCYSSTVASVLKIGDKLRQTRVFSAEDVAEYSKVSHDLNPLHFVPEFARTAGFSDRIVHGMLVAALFPWIIASHFPGAVYASQSLHFKSPVYVGDEITGEVEAINVREHKQKYIAKFSTKCFKEGGLIVLDGEATAILPTLAVGKGWSHG